MEGLDCGQRSAAFLRVREGLGLLERFVAGADCLGDLIEFRRLRLFHQRAGMSSGATARALRLASARVSVAVGVRRVLSPICCRVWARSRRLSSMPVSAARLRAWSLSRAALAPSARVSSSTIEASRAAMNSRRLVSPSRRSVRKSGSLGGEGAELVEERLLGLQLLAERKAWVAVHDSLQEARAWRDTTYRIAAARFLAGCWKFKVGCRKFTDACAVKLFC
jgi:hypothetical protein